MALRILNYTHVSMFVSRSTATLQFARVRHLASQTRSTTSPSPSPSSKPLSSDQRAASPQNVRPEVSSFVEKLKARRVPGVEGTEALAGLSIRAWEQAPKATLIARVNAAFAIAAFPVHAYGFMVGLSLWLLSWPALFSVTWLGYSIARARRTVSALALLPGGQARLFTRSFFGTESARIDVPLSAIRVLPQTERQRKSGICYFDVYLTKATAASKAETERFVIEVHSGKVLDAASFKRILH